MLRFKNNDGMEYPTPQKEILDNIGTFYGGLSGKTKEDFGKGNGKFITYMNVYKNTFTSHDMLESVDVAEAEHQNTVSYGDILMSQSSETVEEVGLSSVYLFNDEPYLNSFCFGFHLSDLDITYPQYMGYLMRSDGVRRQIVREGQGISRINLSPNRIRNITVQIPSLEEQRKIANCLLSVDAVIADYETQVENMQNQKKGIMQKLFSQEVRFKDDDGNSFSEWGKASLINIAERIIVGLATTVTPYYRECGIPLFRNLNIRQGRLDDTDMLYLDEAYANKQTSKVIHKGDILTVHTGNIGWSCLVPDRYEGALSFTTLITTVDNNIADNRYIAFYLNSPMGMKGMQELAFNAGRANLNTKEFEKLMIPLPSIEEQRNISDCLTAFDEAIEDLQKTVEHWKNIKKGLLQQLFA